MLHNFGPKTSCEEGARFMQERVHDTEKNLTALCEVFSQYSVATAKIRDKSDKLGKITLDFSKNEKLNSSLAEGLQKFGESMHNLGDYGDSRTRTVQNKVTEDFSKYGEFCKRVKKDIVTIVEAKDKEYDRKRQFERLKERGTLNRQQILHAEQEMVKASSELTKTVHSVEEKIIHFEKEKIHNVKSTLLDFISTEMGYHARALEVLSRAFNDVEKIDEVNDLKQFKKSLSEASIIIPESSPTSEPRSSFFRPSQSLGSIAAIFSNSHRKRGQGIPHSKSAEKTMESQRGIDSGSSEAQDTDSQASDEEENSDFYLKSVEDLSSNDESADNTPVVKRGNAKKLV